MINRWFVLLGLLIHGFAHAQPADDAALCRNVANADAAIRHCTAAIQASKAGNETLAEWHVQRGIHWAGKRDYERAVADYSAALKLDPKAPTAHYYRGSAWSNQGDFERAIADFDIAAKLKPDDPVVYHARGIELAVKGDYPRALADFSMALQLNSKADGVHFARGRTYFHASDFARAAADLDAALAARPNIYVALWLFLARKRGGDEGAEDLLERETRRLRGGWPTPLIALFMGRTDIASINIAANASEPALRRDTLCEADFYVAQAHLIKGEHKPAQALLQRVLGNCRKNLLEYEGALAEARRLRQGVAKFNN